MLKINQKTKCFIVLAIMVMIVAVSTIVTAETTDSTNYSVEMTLTSNSKLKAGDIVAVTINLSKIETDGKGVDAITATLDYDKSVFEEISLSNFTITNNWTPSYATSTDRLTLTKDSKALTPEPVLVMNFRVKSTISTSSTTVTLKEIVASSGRIQDNETGDINVKNASVTIKAETVLPDPSTDTTPTTPTTTINKTDKTTTNTNIPKTGIGVASVIAIIVISTVAVVSYMLYKKNTIE